MNGRKVAISIMIIDMVVCFVFHESLSPFILLWFRRLQVFDNIRLDEQI